MNPPSGDVAPAAGWPVARFLSLACVLGAVLMIVSTYSTFSQTWDEPAHIAAGMEWLDRGRFDYEELTPPLARVAGALGPWLAGGHTHGVADIWQEGNAILHEGNRYVWHLTLARLGMLPFFLLACFVVWKWSRRLFGEGAALASVALFCTLPPVLAHAGLAATDFALAATLSAAFYALVRWLESPTPRTSVWLGATAALAVLSKFSAIPFLIIAAVAILVLRWLLRPRATTPPSTAAPATPKPALRTSLAVLALTGALVIWAGYRFEIHPIVSRAHGPHPALDRRIGTTGPLHDVVTRLVEMPIYPARAFFKGLRAVPGRNRQGHKSFLDGELTFAGRWDFFPVALAVKTPLPFLVCFATGLTALAFDRVRRRDWQVWAPLLSAGAVLLVSMSGNLNLGVRLVLGLYPPLAVLAGYGVARLWSSSVPARVPARVLVVGLLLWQGIATVRTRPDFIAYFNEFVGAHPEHFLVDSDLDWGQDLLRLEDTLRVRGIDTLSIGYSGSADLTKHSLPPYHVLEPNERVTGWVALSMYTLQEGRAKDRLPLATGYRWLAAYPPEARVGRSIMLYRLPEAPR